MTTFNGQIIYKRLIFHSYVSLLEGTIFVDWTKIPVLQWARHVNVHRSHEV